MSLEQALEANTAAVRALTLALAVTSIAKTVTETQARVVEGATPPGKSSSGKANDTPVSDAPHDTGDTKDEVKEEKPKKVKIAFADLATQFKALIAQDRDAAVALVGEYKNAAGAKAAKLGDIPEKFWAEVQTKIVEAING